MTLLVMMLSSWMQQLRVDDSSCLEKEGPLECTNVSQHLQTAVQQQKPESVLDLTPKFDTSLKFVNRL